MTDFKDRLYKELQTVEEFRFKFSMAKIAFVTTLLGIGSVKLAGNSPDASRVLYLAPLVAVLFDILGMGATVAIYRIDAFLRVKGDTEEQWQTFLKENRNDFSMYAAIGFTILTFLASFAGILISFVPDDRPDRLTLGIWFSCIAVLWIFFRAWEAQIKHSLRSIKSLEEKRHYSFLWCGRR